MIVTVVNSGQPSNVSGSTVTPLSSTVTIWPLMPSISSSFSSSIPSLTVSLPSSETDTFSFSRGLFSSGVEEEEDDEEEEEDNEEEEEEGVEDEEGESSFGREAEGALEGLDDASSSMSQGQAVSRPVASAAARVRASYFFTRIGRFLLFLVRKSVLSRTRLFA